MPQGPCEVTQLLIAWGKGNDSALEQLAPIVESELRRIALMTAIAGKATTRT